MLIIVLSTLIVILFISFNDPVRYLLLLFYTLGQETEEIACDYIANKWQT